MQQIFLFGIDNYKHTELSLLKSSFRLRKIISTDLEYRLFFQLKRVKKLRIREFFDSIKHVSDFPINCVLEILYFG